LRLAENGCSSAFKFNLILKCVDLQQTVENPPKNLS